MSQILLHRANTARRCGSVGLSLGHVLQVLLAQPDTHAAHTEYLDEMHAAMGRQLTATACKGLVIYCRCNQVCLGNAPSHANAGNAAAMSHHYIGPSWFCYAIPAGMTAASCVPWPLGAALGACIRLCSRSGHEILTQQ